MACLESLGSGALFTGRGATEPRHHSPERQGAILTHALVSQAEHLVGIGLALHIVGQARNVERLCQEINGLPHDIKKHTQSAAWHRHGPPYDTGDQLIV